MFDANHDCSLQDKPAVSHSVEALIQNPPGERKSVELLRYKSLNHSVEKNKKKTEETGEAGCYTNGKESPNKGAIDLSLK